MMGLTELKLKVKAAMMRNVPGMLTCGEFDAFVADYFEGTLTPSQRRMFELHLKMCSRCRAFLEKYKRTLAYEKRAFKEESFAPLPDAVPEDLVTAILAARDVGGGPPGAGPPVSGSA